jgi:hypothetical protein
MQTSDTIERIATVIVEKRPGTIKHIPARARTLGLWNLVICTRPRGSRVELPDQLSKSEADTEASKADADAQPWATVAKRCR